jgi:hypothetical protein
VVHRGQLGGIEGGGGFGHGSSARIVASLIIRHHGGIKPGDVVSDIIGASARAMVSALIEGKSIAHLPV